MALRHLRTIPASSMPQSGPREAWSSRDPRFESNDGGYETSSKSGILSDILTDEPVVFFSGPHLPTPSSPKLTAPSVLTPKNSDASLQNSSSSSSVLANSNSLVMSSRSAPISDPSVGKVMDYQVAILTSNNYVFTTRPSRKPGDVLWEHGFLRPVHGLSDRSESTAIPACRVPHPFSPQADGRHLPIFSTIKGIGSLGSSSRSKAFSDVPMTDRTQLEQPFRSRQDKSSPQARALETVSPPVPSPSPIPPRPFSQALLTLILEVTRQSSAGRRPRMAPRSDILSATIGYGGRDRWFPSDTQEDAPQAHVVKHNHRHPSFDSHDDLISLGRTDSCVTMDVDALTDEDERDSIHHSPLSPAFGLI
ncbi:hypothetical protein FA13DRAFT_1805472 [Coprinellus micaceus]|uniref:Uncharacterized protein n=1 Tax=Coprinellus micaceus TaxID=71717 RepID=A0A4Y7RZK2_COPMI|nr:hypothetical protein FA13DRAFT_1805472 [Coprinellus micaceus]